MTKTLKTNSEPTPKTRAEKIAKILKKHYDGDTQTDVMDIVADIRHYCHIYDVDFYTMSDSAYMHYMEEIHEDKMNKRGGKETKCSTNAPNADISKTDL
jgi:hypothetical protein